MCLYWAFQDFLTVNPSRIQPDSCVESTMLHLVLWVLPRWREVLWEMCTVYMQCWAHFKPGTCASLDGGIYRQSQSRSLSSTYPVRPKKGGSQSELLFFLLLPPLCIPLLPCSLSSSPPTFFSLISHILPPLSPQFIHISSIKTQPFLVITSMESSEPSNLKKVALVYKSLLKCYCFEVYSKGLWPSF